MFFIAIHALSIQLHYYCRLQIRLLSQAGLQIQPNENNKVIPNIHHDGFFLVGEMLIPSFNFVCFVQVPHMRLLLRTHFSLLYI